MRRARWTGVERQLASSLPGRALEELGERFEQNPHVPGAARRTWVVDGTGGEETRVLLDDLQLGHSDWPEVVDAGALPDLASWLGLADRAWPFVLVVADREGADIRAHRAISRPAAEHAEVTGRTFHITKVAEGDWAQKQYQRTAENAWVENARLVAQEARSLGNRLGRTVLVAGEVRARAEVLRALVADHPDDVVIEIEAGGRAPGPRTRRSGTRSPSVSPPGSARPTRTWPSSWSGVGDAARASPTGSRR